MRKQLLPLLGSTVLAMAFLGHHAALSVERLAANDTANASDLPTKEIVTHGVHVVPESEALKAPAITLRGRDGKVIDPQASSSFPETLDGAAAVVDGISLTIAGKPVRLFGVRPPAPNDRCVREAQANARPCGEVAQEALKARLAGNATVSCHMPPGQRAAMPAAICVDATGLDLGGFLVAEGFVLADTAQSYDYIGAQGVAQSFRRGLWRFR